MSIADDISQWGWIPGWAPMDFPMFQTTACGGNVPGTSPLCPTALRMSFVRM